jgi:hypothetical protein
MPWAFLAKKKESLKNTRQLWVELSPMMKIEWGIGTGKLPKRSTSRRILISYGKIHVRYKAHLKFPRKRRNQLSL